MIYSIIVYLVGVLPISVYKYRQDSWKRPGIKILNSLITFYVFIILTTSSQRIIQWSLRDFYDFIEGEPIWVNITFYILCLAISAFAIFQVIRLAFRIGKARQYFLKVIPLLWLITGIQKYYTYPMVFDKYPDLEFTLSNQAFSTAIWIGIFLFYRHKSTKDFLYGQQSNGY